MFLVCSHLSKLKVPIQLISTLSLTLLVKSNVTISSSSIQILSWLSRSTGLNYIYIATINLITLFLYLILLLSLAAICPFSTLITLYLSMLWTQSRGNILSLITKTSNLWDIRSQLEPILWFSLITILFQQTLTWQSWTILYLVLYVKS